MLNDFELKTVPAELHAHAADIRKATMDIKVEDKYNLRIEFGGGNTAFMVVETCAIDVRDPNKKVLIHKGRSFDMRYTDVSALPNIARKVLFDLATHEVDEHLSVGGVLVNNPHATKRPTILVYQGEEIVDIIEV